MIRRIVCLLLVPALLANQAAMCCAHTHFDSDTHGHSSRSHFHFSGGNHNPDARDHQHGNHQHGNHQHGNHQHGEHSGDLTADDAESNLHFTSRCPVDHDGDAIFFGEQDFLQFQASRVTDENPTFNSIYFVPQRSQVEIQSYRIHLARAGPFLPYRCAIFLQTLSLLI